MEIAVVKYLEKLFQNSYTLIKDKAIIILLYHYFIYYNFLP